jgi:hypothetical protein
MKIQTVNIYEALGLDDIITFANKNNLIETYKK